MTVCESEVCVGTGGCGGRGAIHAGRDRSRQAQWYRLALPTTQKVEARGSQVQGPLRHQMDIKSG